MSGSFHDSFSFEKGPLWFTKKAYGVDMFEIHFNEQKLVRLFAQNALKIIDINTQSVIWDNKIQDALAWKTFLCEKI